MAMIDHRSRLPELAPLLTAADVQALLKLRSIRTVYSLVDQGVLPYRRVGKRMLRFSLEEVLEAIGPKRIAGERSGG
jgi:hypothetical protein